jgi:hypothetical protein
MANASNRSGLDKQPSLETAAKSSRSVLTQNDGALNPAASSDPYKRTLRLLTVCPVYRVHATLP